MDGCDKLTTNTKRDHHLPLLLPPPLSRARLPVQRESRSIDVDDARATDQVDNTLARPATRPGQVEDRVDDDEAPPLLGRRVNFDDTWPTTTQGRATTPGHQR